MEKPVGMLLTETCENNIQNGSPNSQQKERLVSVVISCLKHLSIVQQFVLHASLSLIWQRKYIVDYF